MRGAICSVLLAAYAQVQAAEGMWTLDNLPREALQSQYRFSPDQGWVDKVMQASVRLAGGCSGSFVSADGLVLTNWHCIMDCVQQLSSAGANYARDGFLARRRADELQCPDVELNRLENISDVTARVREATGGLSGRDYQDALRKARSEIESECAQGEAGRRCDVVDLYHGGLHHLYAYRRYQDVRLVFAPETAVGFFGGDPDNFNYPRYNLDAAFLRAYDDGQPARVEHYFRMDTSGARDGELVMVTGHPGSTQRQLTVSQLQTRRDVDLVERLLYLAELRGLLTQYVTGGEQAQLAAQSDLLSAENSYKALYGRLRALQDPAVFERKRQDEAELRAFVEADEERAQRWSSAWDDIAGAQAAYADVETAYKLIELRRGFLSRHFEIARHLVRAAEERDKPNDQRLREYSDAALPRLQQTLFSDAPVYPDYEKLRLAWSLGKLRERLGADDPFVRLVLGAESPQQLAARLVDGTALADVAERRRLWEVGETAVAQSTDPMIELVRAIDMPAREIRSRFENEVEAVELQAAEQLASARFERYGTGVYPDATFTLRLSHGEVRGWSERGRDIAPFTDFAGLFRRVTGAPPYALPERWLERRGRIREGTPLNFVATTDVIGGNSGSPVINRRADVVGLVFDGNIHSLGGAYWFDERLNRTVAVHSAAIVEALRRVYDADALVKELNAR